MTMNQISVGIDSSDLADTALAWSLALAAESGASVQAIATWEMPLIAKLPNQIHGRPTAEFMTTEASKTLASTVDRIVEQSTQSVEIEQRVVEGKPGPTLVELSGPSDLLVVGRTGYGKRYGLARLSELTLGSTAKHCVHHATVPIATIPADTTWASNPEVLVAVDGSPDSLAALDWAVAALPPTSSLHIVRACEPWLGDGLVPQDIFEMDQIHRDLEKQTQEMLDSRNDQLESREFKLEVVVATAQRAILHPGYKPDLIVVGKRSRNPIASMVLGSVSDFAVRYARCPVVVVPSH